tara:strand:+ start:7693 stop:8250 length:558 start_codon:yes stop_codon:yes gene_type:complete
MKISIDTDEIFKLRMSPNDYIILAYLHAGKPLEELGNWVVEEIKSLAMTKYIREIPDSELTYPYALTGDGLLLFEETSDFNTFVGNYRDLFPKGVKSGNGTPIRGDLQGIAKKMEWFLRMYPEYSRTTILAATKLYVDQMQRKGYAYMTQADYFIKKDDGSKLAAMCEDFNVKTSHILSVGEKRL